MWLTIAIVAGYGIDKLGAKNVTALWETDRNAVRRSELAKTCETLHVLAEEISCTAESRPTRIAFLPADIARLFALMPFLTFVMYEDLLRLRAAAGF